MLLPNDAGIVWENMVREMEMAWAYDIYSSADRRVRDTHYVPDLGRLIVHVLSINS